MANKEKELGSKNVEEEDEEVEQFLDELIEEELGKEDLKEKELEKTLTKSKIESKIGIEIEKKEILAEKELGILKEKEISTVQDVTTDSATMAQVSKENDLEQIAKIQVKNSKSGESLLTDQAVDELEKVQVQSVKDKFKDLPGYIEAILFESGKPLKEPELVDLLYDKFKADKNRIRWGLRKVMRALEAQNSSIQLINPTKDFWSFQLRRDLPDEFIDKIDEFIPEEEYISKREIEFLTEIAYRQPVTTTEILKILGTDGYDYIRSLEAKDLIILTKEGQSNVLRTTEKFAQIFGFDPELRRLKLQLVWRLKKLARSQAAKDKDTLAQLKRDREKYEK